MSPSTTTTTTTTTRSRRGLRLGIGATVGAALAIAVPLAASAHVHVTPGEALAEQSTTLTFSFSHGCEESPTTALAIDIPDGVTNVVPVADAGWSIERTLADNGAVSRVVFTATTPVESGVKGEVSLDARFAADLANSDVAFPVTQECVTGATAWTEVAAEGGAEPESPAPVVGVGDVAADEDGHGGAHGGDGDHEDAAEDAVDASAATASDPIGVWLGASGLVLGAAALVVAIAALVRRRRA